MPYNERRLWKARLAAFTIGISTVSANICVEAGQYEGTPVFTASQVVPTDLARSSNYNISERVGLENFQYVYQTQTKWGHFEVKGSDLLRVRAREMASTARLETV